MIFPPQDSICPEEVVTTGLAVNVPPENIDHAALCRKKTEKAQWDLVQASRPRRPPGELALNFDAYSQAGFLTGRRRFTFSFIFSYAFLQGLGVRLVKFAGFAHVVQQAYQAFPAILRKGSIDQFLQ